MFATLVLLLAAAPLKLAAPGLTCLNLDPKLGATYMNHFNQQLTLKGGFRVTSADEIGQVVGLERQRQLMGCGEASSSCTAEIASAFGVDAIIVGSLNKTAKGFLINLKVLSAKDASALAVYSGRPTSEDELLDLLETWAKDFSVRYASSAPLSTALNASRPAAATTVTQSTINLPAVVVASAAAVALVGGGIVFGLSKGTATSVRAPGSSVMTSTDYQGLIQNGRTLEMAGLIVMGTGAALAVTSMVLFATSKASAPSVSFFAGPGSAGLVFTGSLP